MLDYRGGKTTLCAGCGHNAISERIIDAFYEMGMAPERVVKMSGIGCSSKSPAYFMSRSHSFNSVHGRMPSVATGAVLANSKLIALGVSGDGDTASIGIGQFVHLMRRNLPDDLHHRRQRRVRTDQGPVLRHRRYWVEAEDGRDQRTAADRHLRAGDLAGRDVRGALVLRRQAAAAHHAEGGIWRTAAR